MPSSLSCSSCMWASPPLKPACCHGCQQIIRLVIKNLGSIFAQVFRCPGAIGYHLVRAPGTLEANFYLKGQSGVLFLDWERDQDPAKVILQASNTSGIPVAYCFRLLERMLPPRRQQEEDRTRLTLVPGHDKAQALLVSSSLNRKSQNQGLGCSSEWSSI